MEKAYHRSTDRRTPDVVDLDPEPTSSRSSHSDRGRRRGGDKNEDHMWRGAEWLAVVLFACCAVIAAGGAVVVSVFAVRLVDTISDQTRIYVESTATSVAGPISSFCETLQPVVKAFCSDVADASTTPRTPTAAEVATYGFWNYTISGCTGCKAYATMTDFGGVGQVIFMAQLFNDSQLQSMVEQYFWGTGAMAPLIENLESAWPEVVSQMYYQGKNGFSLIYPYFPIYFMQMVHTYFPLPGVTDDQGFTWLNVYIDKITRKWVTSVYYELYDSRIPNPYGGSLGRCGMDAYITQIIGQVTKMTSSLSNGAYVVLASYDGTLMMIPEAGSADWVSGEDKEYQQPDGSFNYTHILETPDYNLTEWNIFSNGRYKGISEAITPTLELYNTTETHIATIQFATGSRFISWCFVPRSRWIVISVIDEEKATADERNAMVLMICISTVLGVAMVIAAGAIGAYSAVTRKYAGLSAKIADLSTELDQMKNMSLKSGQNQEDMAAVKALSSGVQPIIEVLVDIADHPDSPLTAEMVERVRDARRLLLFKDFKVVKATTQLNSDQKQFVHDCGIEMDHTALTSSMLETFMSRSMPGQNAPDCALSTQTIPGIGNWRFNVFEVAKTVGEDNFLQSVFFSVLSEQHITSSGLPVNYPHLQGFIRFLETDYCSSTGSDKASPPFNPYHNKYHAADVVQAFHSMLSRAEEASPEFSATLTPLERLACFVAAVSHDYKHPGRNNVFLRETFHPTYVTFVESALERSHAAYSLTALFLNPECQPLAQFTLHQRQDFHSLVSKLIYATDMAKHVELVDALKAWVPENTEDKAGAIAATPPGKLLILQLLLKAADISNAYREWGVCQQWTKNLMNEFAEQGADEKLRNLPTSKFMDGRASALEMQNSFVPLFVIPLLKALQLLFPNFHELEQMAWDNLQQWRSQSEAPSSRSSASQQNARTTAKH
ncbi:cAMP-specific 3',5'-cAMP phosphodiesterase 4 [Pelomyxa schiedti]|nr:cAMP-specific 3',5'-cAMP phosphodiesterase 4 [Pelomyxa schiedti]